MKRKDAATAKNPRGAFFAAWRFAPLLGLLLALISGVAAAQTPAPSDDEVNRVAKQLYCPVCENVPLDVCPTTACAQWRATIREKLAQGWSERQIQDFFAEQYGARVLASPPATGLSVLVWILPPLAVAAGAVILWRFLRGHTRPAVAMPPSEPPPTDEYAARLEDELKKRR
jgi:cytochrome c-type biogenesis protein CcmH